MLHNLDERTVQTFWIVVYLFGIIPFNKFYKKLLVDKLMTSNKEIDVLIL